MEVLDTVVTPDKLEEINRVVGFAASIGQTHWPFVCTSTIKMALVTTSTILGDRRQEFRQPSSRTSWFSRG
jgi:hypothetical protein